MIAHHAVRGVFVAALLAGAVVMGTSQIAVAGPTLDGVKARGELVCGVHTGLYGFSAPDDKGVWRGIDVDVCRAVAAAVFGSDKKVKYIPLSAQARLRHFLISSWMRAASVSTAKGFVSTDMPGSSWPLWSSAFSA